MAVNMEVLFINDDQLSQIILYFFGESKGQGLTMVMEELHGPSLV